MTGRLPYIQVSGTHHEAGRQLGEEARGLIARSLACYEEMLPGCVGYGFAESVERARAYLRPAQEHLPRCVEQIQGLSEGSGVPFEQLFALSCSEQFTCLPDQPPAPGHEKSAGAGPAAAGSRIAAPEHCTSFAFVAGGRPVAGHNEDWYPGDIECLVIRDVTLAEGTRYLAVGSPAYLPITALTSHGICNSADTLSSWDMRVGVLNNLVLTAINECRSIDEARDLIEALPRARGSNHLFCDADGRICDIETTATRFAWLDGGTCFAHTNHYVTPELASQDATTSEGTHKRRARAEELLAAGIDAGGDPVTLAQSVLRDHADAPLSICSHWDEDDPDPGQSVTTVSQVWEPADGRLHVAVGPPCEHDYVTYSL